MRDDATVHSRQSMPVDVATQTYTSTPARLGQARAVFQLGDAPDDGSSGLPTAARSARRDHAAAQRNPSPHVRRLTSLGVRFIAVTQSVDTDESNPMAPFPLDLMAVFAELEREIMRERITAGVRAARANHKALGRPKRVFRRDEAPPLR